MKQQIVDRARGVVEALLRKQYPDGALAVLLVKPDVEASPVVTFVAESDVGEYLNEDATVMPC